MTFGKMTTYQAGLIQAKAYRRLKAYLAAQLKPYDLTMMEWAVIGYLSDHSSGLRTSDLAAVFDVEASFMTNMINQLESRRLVRRTSDPKDQRAKLVKASTRCRKLVQTVETELRLALKDRMRDVKRADLRTYVMVLRQLAELPEK